MEIRYCTTKQLKVVASLCFIIIKWALHVLIFPFPSVLVIIRLSLLSLRFRFYAEKLFWDFNSTLLAFAAKRMLHKLSLK